MTKHSSALVFLLIFFSVGYSSGQELSRLEKNVEHLENVFARSASERDSLESAYKWKVEEIEAEKKRKPRDEAKITRLMSASVTISNLLTETQSRGRAQERQLRTMKKALAREYTQVIDSLTALREKGAQGTAGREIDARILSLMAKRFKTGHEAPSFSFDVQKVISMDPDEIGDPVQRRLFFDYLQNAVREIDDVIRGVDETSAQLSQITKLQKRAAGFLEEQDFSTFSQTRKQTTSARETREYGILHSAKDVRTNLQNTMAGYSAVLSEMALRGGTGLYAPRFSGATHQGKSLPVKEYQALLKELKSRLNEFRELLQKKIER